MNNLTITNQNGQLVTDSREVAEMTGKEHSKLLRDIRTYSDYLAEANFGLGDFFIESEYFDENNQERPCYLLTKKGCDMVANKMTGSKGIIFTATYVTKFEEMEKQLSNPVNEYLEMGEEDREILYFQKAKQPKLLLLQNEENKLKVEGYDNFIGTENLLEWDTVAKNLGIGKNTMLKTLRGNKILQTYQYEYKGKTCHGDSHNVPYQRYMEYFDVKYSVKNGRRFPKVLVTAKGQDYLRKKLKEILGQVA